MRRPTGERLKASPEHAATLHLSPLGATLPDWHIAAPRTLDEAEAAAWSYAPENPQAAARAYGVLVRAAELARADVVERLTGFDRVRVMLGVDQ